MCGCGDAMWEGIEIGCDAARLLLNVAEGRLCKEGVMCGPWPNGEGRERGERYRADDEGTLCAVCARQPIGDEICGSRRGSRTNVFLLVA